MNIRGTIATAIAAALAAVLFAPTSTHAADAEPPSGKWETPNVQVYVGPGLEGWKIPKAVRSWRGLGIVNLSITRQPCEQCIVFELRDEYDAGEGIGTRWAGLATPWRSEDGVFDRCVIQLNSRIMVGMREPSIATHEIGHCLGLGHANDEESVMFYSPDEQAPTVYDFANLARLYYPDL